MCISGAISFGPKTYKEITENRRHYLSRTKGVTSSELLRQAFFHIHQELTLRKVATTY